MILQELTAHYETLRRLDNPPVPEMGYAREKVNFAAVLTPDGELFDFEDLQVQKGKKQVASIKIIPQRVQRSIDVQPNVLCDNSTYVLGIDDKGKPTRSRKCFESFKRRNLEAFEKIDEPIVQAFIKFLSKWQPENALCHPVVERYKESVFRASNIVFKLRGEAPYLHECEAVRQHLNQLRESEDEIWETQCLISGDIQPIARLHTPIKGVVGAQKSGASIVSFNKSAFESYGKSGKKGWNAPVGMKSVFAYTTVLNYLTQSENNHIRIGDTTVVFWSEKPEKQQEVFFKALIDPKVNDEEEDLILPSKGSDREMKAILQACYGTKEIRENVALDGDVQFYILGLSSTSSRLSVRFWYTNTFGHIIDNLLQHYRDIAVYSRFKTNPYIPLWLILKETDPLKDMKKVSPFLAGNVTRAFLMNKPYSRDIYMKLISRIKMDRDVNHRRVAMIKGVLVREARFGKINQEEAVYTVGLNLENSNQGYLLGRLFAVLEKNQKDADESVKATIKDRYFGSAMTTPALVFPQLTRLTQHHSKSTKYSGYIDAWITEICDKVLGFPKTLNMTDQGEFVLGYYHQKQALYTKKSEEKGAI